VSRHDERPRVGAKPGPPSERAILRDILAESKKHTALLVHIGHLLEDYVNPPADTLKIQIFTQPAGTPALHPPETAGGSPMSLGNAVPLPPDTEVPVGSRIVLVVHPWNSARNMPARLTGDLVATSDAGTAAPVVDATDPKNIEVRIEPPADRTLDSDIVLQDSGNGLISIGVHIDWDASSVVVLADGAKIDTMTEPIV